MSKNDITDLSESVYTANSVPDAIRNQINKLNSLNSLDYSILANKMEVYYNYICNRKLLNEQREHFNNFYDEIDKHCPEVLFRLEGRRKSFTSAYKKLLNNSSVDYVLKDISAFRIILFGKTSELIDMCYTLAEHIIKFSVKQGFVPCIAEAEKNTEGFVQQKHPDVFVPKKNNLSEGLKKYVKDYILNPKTNGYQSLHIIFMDKEGNYFEVQIRTIDMHVLAEFGSAEHKKYKEQYGPLHLDRTKIRIPGYWYSNGEVLDFIGLEESLEILRRQKTHA